MQEKIIIGIPCMHRFYGTIQEFRLFLLLIDIARAYIYIYKASSEARMTSAYPNAGLNTVHIEMTSKPVNITLNDIEICNLTLKVH